MSMTIDDVWHQIDRMYAGIAQVRDTRSLAADMLREKMMILRANIEPSEWTFEELMEMMRESK